MATIDIGKIKPVFKGTYDNSTAYVLDDIVYYNGSSYVAKTSTTGNLPTDTTKWNILASGSGGIWDSTLSLGSAGQVVKVNSGASALEFGTLSSDYVKLATHTVSSAVSSVSIDGNGSWADNTLYGGYKFYMRNISTSNDSGSSVVRFRVNFSGTAHSGANYYSVAKQGSSTSSSSSIGASYDWGSSQFSLSYNNMDSEEARSGYGIVELLNTGGDENGGSGSYWIHIMSDFYSHHSNSSSIYNMNQMGHLANNAPISGITLIPTGGNIDLGTITVYGRKK